MNAAEVREIICREYERLRQLAQRKTQGGELLERALKAALEGEREHRASYDVETYGRPQQSVDAAAKYFVVKWAVEPAAVSDALQACEVRQDCLYASALGVWARRRGTPFVVEGRFWDIDYAEHIASKPKGPKS